MRIEPLNPYSAAATKLLAMSDAYMASLYPAESNHMASPDTLAQPHVLFLGLTIDQTVAACGAVKVMDDDGQYGEVKRLFVLPEFRGMGLSRALMVALESHLQSRQIAWARLETGIHQPEALALYQRLGYRERGPFGTYRLDPYSVFMEKRLTAEPQSNL
ncbi:MAG: GNAT family N-acetyltransferase [Burkholderiaceae bacterium]|nr:GNAT family N-acetyltransferase [Burkholderiaceae bacterium]